MPLREPLSPRATDHGIMPKECTNKGRALFIENQTMKVKELIAELQKLDQDKNIWNIYDSFAVYPPSIELADRSDIGYYKGIEEGDYVMYHG